MSYTAALAAEVSTIKAHLVDPVVTAVIQDRLSDPIAVKFALDLVSIAKLKVRGMSSQSYRNADSCV